MIAQIIAAFVGTIAFALIFGVPGKYYFLCGITGAAGWFFYLLFMHIGATATESTFIATVVVVVLSRIFSVIAKSPVTVFLISGIIPLVPGGGMYWTSYYLVTNQNSMALDSGISAVRSAVAIVLGIVIVLELPNKLFHLKKKKDIRSEYNGK